MESNPMCKEHEKPIQSICLTCKEFSCIKCQAQHIKKGCKGCSDISTYAAEELLPKYKSMLDDLEQNKGFMQESMKEFVQVLPGVKKGLILLKEKAEKLAKQINKTLENLEGNINPLGQYENIKTSIIQKYKDLQLAIEKDSIAFIIKLITKDSEALPAIGDGEKRLIEATNIAVTKLSESPEFDALNECLQALTETCGKLEYAENNGAPIVSEFVYGVCNPIGGRKELCRYNISTKKISKCIAVPLVSSVLQTGKHVFVSGGYNPYVNTMHEFLEESSSLIPKAPMVYPKYGHRMVSISPTHFLTVGGYYNAYLPHCEEYSIAEDKWSPFPALNFPRYYAGTALLDKSYLYVIGGNNSDEIIEAINLKERKAWTIITLTTKKISFEHNPVAFPVSSSEIIILRGNGTTDVGIFDIKTASVTKYSQTIKEDYYYSTPMFMINGNAYIIGYYGHLHIFNMAESKFDIVEFSP